MIWKIGATTAHGYASLMNRLLSITSSCKRYLDIHTCHCRKDWIVGHESAFIAVRMRQ